jgi:hypothetical protein
VKLDKSLIARAVPHGSISRKPSADRVVIPRGMNKLEAAYARHLDFRIRGGEVMWWKSQAPRLPITDARGKRRCYTPDFMVLLSDGRTEFHETKGFMREAAGLRIDVAATVYPLHTFVIVRRDGDGWAYEYVRAGGGK